MERSVVCEWMFVNFVRVRAGGGEGLCVRGEGGERLLVLLETHFLQIRQRN